MVLDIFESSNLWQSMVLVNMYLLFIIIGPLSFIIPCRLHDHWIRTTTLALSAVEGSQRFVSKVRDHGLIRGPTRRSSAHIGMTHRSQRTVDAPAISSTGSSAGSASCSPAAKRIKADTAAGPAIGSRSAPTGAVRTGDDPRASSSTGHCCRRTRRHNHWRVHLGQGCDGLAASLAVLSGGEGSGGSGKDEIDSGVRVASVAASPGADGFTWERVGMLDSPDLVWVLTEDESNTSTLAEATAASVLDNVGVVLSSKAGLAMLQRQSKLSHLETFVLEGADAAERWCRDRFRPDVQDSSGAATTAPPIPPDHCTSPGWRGADNDLWMLKDALSNSGCGIWLVGPHNWRECVERARCHDPNADFVLQRYVTNPSLWGGTHKYHLRVYAALTGGLGLLIYRLAFAHVANNPWSLEFDPSGSGYDPATHITNVAANVHDQQLFHGYAR